uniref:N-acetylglucosamine-6-phosphate deacetylase n=1 Tax=Cyprinus carpio TaxID=7962 RepID=A0A8C1J0M6_CYPCA
MPSNKSVSDAPITQFVNCRILKDHKLQWEDLWVREGKILNPEKLFFDEEGFADHKVDCEDKIIAPGFIDVQINGGYGIDFSQASSDIRGGVALVAKKILEHGVTSFCPTLVTSPSDIYHKVIPELRVQDGGPEGAGVLGIHLEGPFISEEKRGAHPPKFLRTFKAGGLADLMEIYGHLDNVAMVTLAPELANSAAAIHELSGRGIAVSLGHSMADLSQAEEAVQHGAKFITHLFNAMLPFHHRDPGIVGLLTSDRVPPGRTVYYGMIADGIHTHPAALRIAHRAHPAGLVLVTDAVMAMGLPPGRHTLGQQQIDIQGLHAYLTGLRHLLSAFSHVFIHSFLISGTTTLSGSIATMDMCVRHFREASGCTVEAALEAASLHPAQMLGISHRKGTLEYGTDADFVVLDDTLTVRETYIAGQQVWRK